ncbi:MAG: glycoside hydrolase family 43, partial [Humibacillus sp.]
MRTLTASLAALVTAVGLTAAAPASGSQTAVTLPSGPSPTSYDNAVSDSFSDTFADPSVIRGRDGWWYAYATSDPLRAGEAPGAIHMARTKDWSSWEYL